MASDRPLWEGHRERLRRRVEREGWDALRPHEMVELVLYHAVPRQDLSDISRALVHHFGSVGGVFSAPGDRLMQVQGMTPWLADWITATGELMRAYYGLHAQGGIRLNHWQHLFDFLRPRLNQAGDAKLWIIYADFDFNLITYTDLSASEPWWDAGNVRRMVVEAVDAGARYAYLVRFMPVAARELTKEEQSRLEAIAVTLGAVEVSLVDCVLAGGGELHSLNAEGRLQKLRLKSGCLALHEKYASFEPDRQ